MSYLQKGWPEVVTAELQAYELKKTELTMENHTLLWGMRVVIPRKLQDKVLSEFHHNPWYVQNESPGEKSCVVA